MTQRHGEVKNMSLASTSSWTLDVQALFTLQFCTSFLDPSNADISTDVKLHLFPHGCRTHHASLFFPVCMFSELISCWPTLQLNNYISSRKKKRRIYSSSEPLSHLVGVFRGEVLHWWDDALSNQLTVGGRGLLLDQLRFLSANWSKQAVGTESLILGA